MVNCAIHLQTKAPKLCPICLIGERDRLRRALELQIIRSMANSHLWVCLLCNAKGESWAELIHEPDCPLFQGDVDE